MLRHPHPIPPCKVFIANALFFKVLITNALDVNIFYQ
jgi:hypothetical protein